MTILDHVMVGRLGASAISAVGVVNKRSFVCTLMLFGMASGASIFSAQFWGKGDLASIHKVLGVTLRFSLVIALPFFLLSQLLPHRFMAFFIREATVVSQGATFLNIIGWSYLIQAISMTYAIQCRGVGRTRPSMYASAVALGVNSILNYGLINGRLGLPAWGVPGAAVATLVARGVEVALLLGLIYGQKLELAASFRGMRDVSKSFLNRFLKTTWPVLANEGLWASGVSMYTFFYGMQGVAATAAAQIVEDIHGLFFSVFIGLASACGTMVGNRIGAGDNAMAKTYAYRSVAMGILLGWVMGLALLILTPAFLAFFKVGSVIHHACRMASYVFAATLFVRAINVVMVVGICRNGGDTVFAAMLDVLAPWCVGVPMAALGVIFFHWPIYWVMALISLEECVKASFCLWRLRSGRWLNNLVRDVEEGEALCPFAQ